MGKSIPSQRRFMDHTEFMVVIGGLRRMGASSVISNGVRNPCLERSERSFGLRQERISPAGRNNGMDSPFEDGIKCAKLETN